MHGDRAGQRRREPPVRQIRFRAQPLDHRPAARQQLAIVAKSIGANIYEGDLKGETANTIPRAAARSARQRRARFS